MEENKCANCSADLVEGKCPNCSVEAAATDAPADAPAEGGEMAAPEAAAAPEGEEKAAE